MTTRTPRRTDAAGYPYANDTARIAPAAAAMAEKIWELTAPQAYPPSPVDQAMIDTAEYGGMVNSEYWLALAEAGMILQRKALDCLYGLVGDKEDDDEEWAEAMIRASSAA